MLQLLGSGSSLCYRYSLLSIMLSQLDVSECVRDEALWTFHNTFLFSIAYFLWCRKSESFTLGPLSWPLVTRISSFYCTPSFYCTLNEDILFLTTLLRILMLAQLIFFKPLNLSFNLPSHIERKGGGSQEDFVVCGKRKCL